MSRGMLPGKKNRNLRSSNCWKCTEIVNPTISTLFLYHFKSFTIPQGGPFWLLEKEGGDAHPAHFPAYGPVITSATSRIFFNVLEICQKQFVVIVNVIKI